jgi:hypothetical protein
MKMALLLHPNSWTIIITNIDLNILPVFSQCCDGWPLMEAAEAGNNGI